MSETTNVLTQPITSLELSEGFKAMAKANHFTTLAEMVEFRIEELQRMPLFDHRMLPEYISFLTKNGLDGEVED